MTIILILSFSIPTFAVTKKIKIYMDPSFKIEYGSSHVSTACYAFYDARTAFNTRFNLNLDIGTYTYYLSSTALANGCQACSSAYGIACNANCGNCGDGSGAVLNYQHHKNGYKNFQLYYNNSDLTDISSTSNNYDKILLVASFKACYTSGSTHKDELGGLANRNGLRAMVILTNRWTNAATNKKLIQHEVSHLFNADDHTGNACIMNGLGVINNVWCSSCETLIKNNIK